MVATIVKLAKAWSGYIQFFKGSYVSSSLGDTGVAVIQVPRKGFVKGIFLDVKTPYTAASTGSVLVGYEDPDGNSTSYFMDNTAAAPLVAGMKTSTKGRYFEKGGLITVTFAKGTSAAHVEARVFADIVPVY